MDDSGFAKVSRNDPCPCGSGKKYKKCCWIKSIANVGPQEILESRLVEDLMRFASKQYQESLEEAYDRFQGGKRREEGFSAEMPVFVEINFHEWFVFDRPVDQSGEKTLIDAYIDSNKRLTQDELEILAKMNSAVISLYEVQEVFPNEGLLLKDLLEDGEYQVREKKATEALCRWDIFAARLLNLDDKFLMSGCVYPFPRHQKESTIRSLVSAFNKCKKTHPEASLTQVRKIAGKTFNDLWLQNARHRRPPILVTTDREPFVFSEALFEIKERKAVIEALRRVPGFQKNARNGFDWLKGADVDGATVLGHVEIEGKSLILRTNSQERLERGKGLILKGLKDLASHRVDSFQDPYQLLAENKDVPEPESTIPIEVRQGVYDRFMRRHMEKWIGEEIPALGGKTPLECVKTGKGRKLVTELLKSFENTEERKRKRGEPSYDLAWEWQRLGLARPE